MQLVPLILVLVAEAAAAALATGTSPVNIVVADNQPVAVRIVRADASDAILIDVENVSDKPLAWFELLLSPASCPGADHPTSTILRSSAGLTLPNGAHSSVVVERSLLERLLNYQRETGCPPNALPEIVLSRAVFCDGTGWRGVAGGPDHSVWTGEPWQPPIAPQC